MCGRFSLSVEKEELSSYLADTFEISTLPDPAFAARTNCAPGQNIMTVLSDGVRYRVGELKWGLVPPFASDPKIGYSMINAKSETLFEKPSYRASITKKRCVILADGFYEWKTEGSQKIPHRIVLKDQKLFAMAGLWSAYQREDGSKLFTCTIITTQANPLVATIHDRMPVILEGANLKEWLDPNRFDRNRLETLLTPYDFNKMRLYPVSSLVNKVSNDSMDLIVPISNK